MANLLVPYKDGVRFPSIAQVKNGLPCNANDWGRFIDLCNYNSMNGGQLISTCYPNVTISGTSAHKFTFRAYKRAQNVQRMWRIYATAPTSLTVAQYTLPEGDVATGAHTPFLSQASNWVEKFETFTQSTKGTQTLELTVTLPLGGSILIRQISCVEIPRGTLRTDNTSDDGISNTWAAPGGLAISDNGDKLGHLGQFINQFDETGLRQSLFNWAVPSHVGGVSSTTFSLNSTATAASPTTLFPLTIPVLGRAGEVDSATKLASTTARIQVAALMKSTGAGSARLNIAATSGDSVLLSTSATTYTLRTGLMDIDSEELAQATGLRGGTPDFLTMTEYASAVGTTAHIAAISVYSLPTF